MGKSIFCILASTLLLITSCNSGSSSPSNSSSSQSPQLTAYPNSGNYTGYGTLPTGKTQSFSGVVESVTGTFYYGFDSENLAVTAIVSGEFKLYNDVCYDGLTTFSPMEYEHRPIFLTNCTLANNGSALLAEYYTGDGQKGVMFMQESAS